jgi:hypothetical protein
MLIKRHPAIDQLAIREARLPNRSIFHGLQTSKMPDHPWPGRKTQKNQRFPKREG